MKRIAIIIALTLAQLAAFAQSKLEVSVENIRTTKGTIRIGIFNSEEKFLKDAIHGKIVKAADDKISVIFENLAPGDYAVSVIHDENENGDLDTNMMGIPKEGFAFGNNAMGMFGPPSFEKAKITLANGATAHQTLKLKYL
jgi:uncharacterized protein (DUF2141 family)